MTTAQVLVIAAVHGLVEKFTSYCWLFKSMISRFTPGARLNEGFQKHDLKNGLVTSAISNASKSYVCFAGAGFEGNKWGVIWLG